MLSSLTGPDSETIRQWEEADVSLTNALTRYVDLSALLGSQLPGNQKSPNKLLDRIDSSFSHLRTALKKQLARLRVALTKSRNRVNSPIYCLPEEILCRIFTDVMHSTDSSTPVGMPNHVRTIYYRLYRLLSVCTVWRNAGLSHGTFWSIIPIVDSGKVQSLSTELLLRRSGDCNLHLAISLEHHRDPLNRFNPLIAYIPRFTTVTINSGISDVAKTIIDTLLTHGATESISKLSLRSNIRARLPRKPKPPQANHYLNPSDYPLQRQFGLLMQSLSVARISHIPLNWNHITFSARLVEFRFERVTFGSRGEAALFLEALTSAHELRYLKINTVKSTFGEQDADDMLLPIMPISLPNLQLLHLGNLTFDDLGLFLGSIAPGSYDLRLFMTDHVKHEWLRAKRWNPVEIERICDLLKQFPVNNLILTEDMFTGMDSWTVAGIRSLLGSMPALKTLILSSRVLKLGVLCALMPPQIPVSSNQSGLLPKLQCLELNCDHILGDWSELRSLIAAQVYPIGKLVLGGYFIDHTGTISNQEMDDIVVWLRGHIPEVCRVDRFRDDQDSGDPWVWQL